jgi:glycosyltransferase involved in cell wall biosynthesis
MYRSLARALAQRGHEVHVICQAVGETKDVIDNGVFVHRVGTNPKRYSAMARINYSFYAWFKLREIIRQYDIEIVEAAYWGAEALLYGLGRRTPLAVRIASSASDILRTRTYSGIKQLGSLKILSFLEDFSVKRADRVVATTKDQYALLIERLHIDPEKVDVIHHAIDVTKYSYVESDVRQRLEMPRDVPLVLFVGRLEARKGVHILCQAIPEIIETMPATKFILVGQDTSSAPDGSSMKAYVIEQAKKGGFGDNLTFIDFLPEGELIELYSACDLVVSPSLQESFGLVVLEAMACGKPVVATATGLVPELGLDGTRGIMVPPGDVGRLAKGIIRLLLLSDDDKNLAAKRNLELVEAEFSIPEWVDKVIEVYEKALKKAAKSPSVNGQRSN